MGLPRARPRGTTCSKSTALFFFSVACSLNIGYSVYMHSIPRAPALVQADVEQNVQERAKLVQHRFQVRFQIERAAVRPLRTLVRDRVGIFFPLVRLAETFFGCMPTDVPESVEDVTAGHLLLTTGPSTRTTHVVRHPTGLRSARIASRDVTDARTLGAAQRCAHVVGRALAGVWYIGSQKNCNGHRCSHLVGNDTCKITVGCPSGTYPSFTFSKRLLSQDHGRLPVVHMSKHSHQNLHTCWTPWSALQKKRLWARADACVCAGVPQPRLFEFTSL